MNETDSHYRLKSLDRRSVRRSKVWQRTNLISASLNLIRSWRLECSGRVHVLDIDRPTGISFSHEGWFRFRAQRD